MKIFNNMLTFFVFLYVFSMCFFSYRSADLGNYTIITKILALIIMIVFIASVIFVKNKFFLSLEFKLLFVWIFFSLLTGFFSSDFNLFFTKTITLLQVFAVSYFVYVIAVNLQSVNIIWFGIFFTTSIVSIFVVKDPVYYSILGRYVGTFGNANVFAMALILSFLYALNQCILQNKLLYKVVYLLSIPLFIYMIAGTGSRKAILIVFVIMLVQVFFRFRNKIIVSPSKSLFIFVAIFILISASAYYFYNSKHFNRIEILYEAAQTGNINKADNSFKGRVYLYKAGLEKVMDSPAFGFGLDNFRSVAGGGRYAHSNIIEILVGTGIIGFFLYYSIYASLAIKLFRLRRINFDQKYNTQYLMTIILFIVFVLYDFAMVSYYEKLSWLMMAGIIASTQILNNNKLFKVTT